jgi:signal transduction histidine kinase/ligand-binding sensor domain-containing protein/DNA-binding response OmpR family regulator
MIFSSISLLCLLSGLVNLLSAQNNPVVFERLSTKDGLPGNSILDIVQDHDGYIWIATEDGLVRYDGYQFLNYQNIPGDSTSLSQNRIEKLFVDYKGDIWVGSKSELDLYSSECDCFFRYSSNKSAPANQGAGQINAFVEDSDLNLWIGTQAGGLFRFERESKRFIRYLDDPDNPYNLLKDEVRVLLVDEKDNLWIGTGETFDPGITGGGLIRYDLKSGSTKRFLHDPDNSNSLIDNRVSALFEDQVGKIWIGTCQSGLHVYEPEKEEIIRMMPDSDHSDQLYAPQGEMGLWSSCPHVRFIHQDQNGAFWVGTYNGGINHYDPATKKLNHYKHDPADPGGISTNAVWSFLEDKQDRLWIGTVPGGLMKVDASLHKFKVYSHQENLPNSLSNDHVLGIFESPQQPGIIWMGTLGGGLNRLDLETGNFQHFRHDPENKHSISSDIVWTTYEDSNGTFWVGTEAGLEVMDRETGKFSPYEILENKVRVPISIPVLRIHEDRQGNLWLGTWSNGIFRLNRDKTEAKRYSFSNGSQQSFYNSVFAIHENEKGMIWAGNFQGGLFHYDITSDSFIHHPAVPGATSLLEDSTGVFWVGTISDGIFHYNSHSGAKKQYTMEDGLPSNIVNGILSDKSGICWVSTGNGIARFDPVTNRFLSFDASDGLTFTGFNHTSSFKSSDGQLFFGGDGGLISFYPDEIKGNPYPPDVVLKGLQRGGKSFQQKGKSRSSSVVNLSYKQNDLTFDYVGLHFTQPSKNSYKYRLKPYDADWIDAGTQRTARYTNLDPGDYTFQVVARSSDGLWNDEGASLHFNIIPPWWTRWWFYGSLILLILGLSYWFYHFQLSRKLAVAESKRLTEIDQLRSSLFTNITHEFRTPLTVILGMTDALQEKLRSNKLLDTVQPLEMIQRNGRNLLQLVNEMLNLAKLESGHLKLEIYQADIIPYIKYICESFQSMAEQKQINFTVISETEHLEMDYDKEKLSVIISNLLSNAIKFTPKGGKIDIQLKTNFAGQQEYLAIKVKDSGKGLSDAEIPFVFDRFYQTDYDSNRHTEGTGIGLALTKELVDLMKGNIVVTSVLGEGSEFLVNIPVNRQAPVLNENPGVSDLSYIPKSGLEFSPEKDQDADLPIVLLIEDNSDVAIYLKGILENKYQILHAQNGVLGLEMAFEMIPDIIVCDVMMPGKDGFEVCAVLKADERTDHIPIIMLTARSEVEDRITGLSRGADAYLAKPFEKAELMIRLEKLLVLRKRLQEKYSSSLANEIIIENHSEPVINSFLVKAREAVLEHLAEENFSIDGLADAVCLSRSQMHRKIKALTGQSSSIYIRMIRLQKAKELLAAEDLSISEVAYRVGFKSPVYFSQVYKNTFGESPGASRK